MLALSVLGIVGLFVWLETGRHPADAVPDARMHSGERREFSRELEQAMAIETRGTPGVESRRVGSREAQPVPPRDLGSMPLDLDSMTVGSIIGQVIDRKTGAPIEGAEVTTGGYPEGVTCGISDSKRVKVTTITDRAGRFALEDLVPGEYLVRIEGPGYACRVRGHLEVLGGKILELGQEELARGASLSGFVVDDSGQVVTGAYVQLSPVESSWERLYLGKKVYTDGQGFFRMENVSVGEYKLYAQRRGTPSESPWAGVADMRRSERSLRVQEGASYSRDLVLEAR